MVNQGSKADVLGLDGRRVQSSVGAIQGNSGKLVEQKFENTNGNIDKPLIIQQQGRGFFSSGSKYEPLKEATVAVGVGVNDKAVTFSPYNFIDPPQLKTNQIDTQQLEAKVKKEDQSISKSDLRQPVYKILRDTTNTTLNIFTGFTGLNPIGNQDFIGGSRPPILQDPVQNSDNQYRVSNISTIKKLELLTNFNSYIMFVTSEGKILLPFFENPIIQEKRGSQYSIVPVLGSSDPLFAFSHTDLANITINFKLNAFHIAEMLNKSKISSKEDFTIKSKENYDKAARAFFDRDTQATNDKFKDGLNLNSQYLLDNPRNENLNKGLRKNLMRDLYDINDADNSNNIAGLYSQSFQNPETNNYYLAQKLITFWINTIKSFNVFGNSNFSSNSNSKEAFKQPLAGRRFIYLKHGPAFHNIPSVLIGYEIKEFNNTTYDVPTHMANVFEITLNLHAQPESWSNAYEGQDQETAGTIQGAPPQQASPGQQAIPNPNSVINVSRGGN